MLSTKGSRVLANSRGQAVIGALIMLPVIAAAFVGLAIAGVAFTVEAKATAACRESLVKSQMEAAEALHELLKLNRQAELAEKGVDVAETGVRIASATGIGIVVAESILVGAKAYQTYVMIQQKRWLLKGKYISMTATVRATDAVREAFPGGFFGEALRSIWDDIVGGDIQSVPAPRTKIARFKVIARPPNARTPTYEAAPDFEKAQLASVHWLLQVPIGSPIRLPGFDFDPQVELGCAAGLKKGKDGQWHPQITEDKLVTSEKILGKRWWN